MKRFLFFFLAMMLAMGGTAFAGEQKILFLRDGKEVLLQDEPIRKNGKWMLTREDMGRLLGCKGVVSEGDGSYFAVGGAEQAVALQNYRGTSIGNGKIYHGIEGGGYRADILQEDAIGNWYDETWYVPCREVAEALDFRVLWQKKDGQESLSLERWRKLPKLTLEMSFDKETNHFLGTIKNQEPQAFLLCDPYAMSNFNRLYRMDGDHWTDIGNLVSYRIDENGLRITPCREGTSEGITKLEWDADRRKISPGKYRMEILFTYQYYTDYKYGSLWAEQVRSEKATKQEQDLYYATRWGKPDFFFIGEGMLASGEAKETEYVLYGEFEVE